MKLRTLLGISAILVAGCAAFFSVTGLGLLFYGASVAVIVMASTLEFAKIIVASYLKQSWKEIERTLRLYLTIALISLMVITSAGIYGFLSDAFQKQSLRLDKVEREVSFIENKIKINEAEIKRYEQKITNFGNIRNSQEQNLTKLIDKEKGTGRISAMIRSADAEIKTASQKIDSLNTTNIGLYQQIETVKNSNQDLEEQVGGFRFVAEALNVDIKTAVKWFILLIVLVFDPLAIALVLAYNSKRKENVNQETTTTTTSSTTLQRTLNLIKKKLMRKPSESSTN
jgi:septal ring factor EnvC (AmiA/AmiB activator)